MHDGLRVVVRQLFDDRDRKQSVQLLASQRGPQRRRTERTYFIAECHSVLAD